MPAIAPSLLLLAAAIVFAGGLVKGIAGFGYAIASTALLATIFAPSTAVVLMILPMLVANVTLLRELDREAFTECLARFWPYGVAAMVGTLLGMALLNVIPTTALTTGLGIFTLGYVAATQQRYELPGEQFVTEHCFEDGVVAKSALGFVSGLVFGVSNVAVQVVAYLDSLSLDRSTFVGVLAMILVGISGIRIGLAWGFGMYQSGSLLLYSAFVSIPGIAGVTTGKYMRQYIPDRCERGGVLVLLTVIGVRLLTRAT
ncbi:MAG: sulfite exporter TauE/SafE family protein [Halobacteriaceae archaeon]